MEKEITENGKRNPNVIIMMFMMQNDTDGLENDRSHMICDTDVT